VNGEFLGVGWDLPSLLWPAADARSGTDWARYEESIRQSVWIILGTAPGERAMRPDFGCGIHDLVFSVQSQTTYAHLAEAVRDALVRWETRIELQDVRVAQGDDPAELRIEIGYRVRTTNNQFNLVYPFYLDRGA
jgi:phage baseplate assembly protein W